MPDTPVSSLYAPLAATFEGHLHRPGGHRVYYEESGRRDGVPVLFLHGGPGSSTKPDHRRYFDPAHYRIVLCDQRGCGRSLPLGSIAENTTAQLVGDIEAIREVLGIERWMMFGGSWGSTLALAYAQTHPQRVTRLILRGIFLASHAELDWYFTGLRQFIPEAWERLYAQAPGASWPALVRSYDAALNHPDGLVAGSAAARWNAYESAIMSIGEAPPMPSAATDVPGAIARARVQVHYLAHDCFLRDRELLHNVHRIAHLPATLLHGRLDFVCPPVTAWELARDWPSARLTFIESAKHASSHPALERALVAAADAARAAG
jgi:proline iminopeptidase